MSITLPNNNDLTYYGGAGDHGEYQYVNISDIKAAFKATYIGSGKICQGVFRKRVYIQRLANLSILFKQVTQRFLIL